MLSFGMYKKIVLVLLVAGFYATLRYVIFGTVYWGNIPTYVLNKTLALSSVFTLFLSAIFYLKSENDKARNWGLASIHLAVYHVILSIMLLSPVYYESFFWQGKLTAQYDLSLGAGAFGLYCYIMLLLSKKKTAAMATFKLLVSMATAVHIFAMAYGTWLNPLIWLGHMPPISLWGFIFVIGALIIFLLHKDIPNRT